MHMYMYILLYMYMYKKKCVCVNITELILHVTELSASLVTEGVCGGIHGQTASF